MCLVRVVIYHNKLVWDRLNAHYDFVYSRASPHDHDFSYGDLCVDGGFNITNPTTFILNPDGDRVICKKRMKFSIILNGHELSYFSYLLHRSIVFRMNVIKYWNQHLRKYIPAFTSVKLSITLFDPPHQIIDLLWNERINYLVSVRTELDTAMSWLSTLGGAYSALGDHFTYCAEMAGRISIKQFQIALKLGDDSFVSRCKLFLALSMIQRKKFRQAQHLIQQQYRMAVNSNCPDIRLSRMCKGVWSKLRYERSKYILEKNSLKKR